MSQPPAGLGPGARIGAYEIVAPIGEGGMGMVYRGVDTRLEREVAVKVLPASFKVDADRLARFRREAELLGALNHPNIAHVYGLEQADGEHALVMELATGGTLAERGRRAAGDRRCPGNRTTSARGPRSRARARHRPSRSQPANIMIGPDGTVKVLDFGLAKALDTSPGATSAAGHGATITSPALTSMGVILGTAAYMSPEQSRFRRR